MTFKLCLTRVLFHEMTFLRILKEFFCQEAFQRVPCSVSLVDGMTTLTCTFERGVGKLRISLEAKN